MAVLKCKMCGGDLNITADAKIVECEYCGTTQTIPDGSDEKKTNLFNRANRLRIANEFDKAAGIYESIIAEFPEEAEAYWGLCLCKFGIEYVDDPKTAKKIPTCHRTSFESIFDDENYKMAIEKADVIAQGVYKEEATVIDNLQKDILSIVHKEESFDVFVCYKETDELGQRTQDSVLAQDIYDALTDKGFKVFFSRITLEAKLGKQYEPYIFAALNSAKVMLAIGTKEEYYNAVWVKNEWSRYLALMESDKSKMLIPCYRDIDPYDMPQEFKNLQGQDMSKLGWMQDLVRGITKIITPIQESTTIYQAAPIGANATTESLLTRAFMFLEDGNSASADEYFEKVLDIDPRCAQAYLGKLLIDCNVQSMLELKALTEPFDAEPSYEKVLRFGDEKLKQELEECLVVIREREAERLREEAYQEAKKLMQQHTVFALSRAKEMLSSILTYKDAADLVKRCAEEIQEHERKIREKAEADRKDAIYVRACDLMCAGRRDVTTKKYLEAIQLFESIPGWKDAAQKIEECKNGISKLEEREEKAKAELARIQERVVQLAAKRRKRNKLLLIVGVSATLAIAVIWILISTVIVPNSKYSKAVSEMDAGNYIEAAVQFEAMNGYRDSAAMAEKCQGLVYEEAMEKHQAGNTPEALVMLYRINKYDSARATIRQLLNELRYASYENKIAVCTDRTVALRADGTVVSTNDEYAYGDTSQWTDIVMLADGSFHVVGLKENGTVVAAGVGDSRTATSDWTDIVAIDANLQLTVGLKADGTVVVTGDTEEHPIDVSAWTDIVAIYAGCEHVVGLKADGTVVAAGENRFDQCYVDSWRDIVAIYTDLAHTVGLKADGTVVAAGVGDGRTAVSDWKEKVAIRVGVMHTVALTEYGYVDITGPEDAGQKEAGEWSDIKAISAGSNHTVALKKDGTVVATGEKNYGRCDVQDWTDIVAVVAGHKHTVGLKADGTVVAVGYNADGQCDVTDWDLF